VPPRSSPRLLAALIALALLPRAAFLAETWNAVEFNAILPGLDQHRFHENALRIAGGDLRLAGDAYEQGPFYSYFTGALYALFAADPRTVRVAQALLGVATSALLFSLALRWLAPGIALFCAALYGLYGFGLFMESALLRASLVTLLYLLLAYALVRHDETGRPAWLVAGGLVLGAAIATRPNSALLAPVAAWALLRAPASDSALGRPARAGLLLAAVLLPLLPFALRNLSEGQPALHFSSQGLKVFVAGNMPDSRGVGWMISERGRELLAEHEERPVRVLLGVAGAALREPLSWGLVQLQKVHALFASYEIPNNLNYYLWSRSSVTLRALPVPVHLIAALGVPGLFFAARAPRRGLLYALFAGVALSILPFYVIARFRLPLIPFLCLFAGFSADALVGAVRERSARRLARLAGALAVAALLTTSPARVRIHPDAHRNLAALYEHAGRPDRAEASYLEALEARPGFRLAAASLMELYLWQGRAEDAREVGRRHLAAQPESPRVRELLRKAERAGSGAQGPSRSSQTR
jgi:hypothetical protein